MQRTLYVLLGVLFVPTIGLVGDIVTDGKFKSTKLTGAPLQVASDDIVANLNSDMVDGIEGTDIYTKAEVDALVAAAAGADSRPRFYLTPDAIYDGNDALTACDAGFHMASIWEILDVSNLRYDTSRGVMSPDSGKGPIQGHGGWIGTGDFSFAAEVVGYANCSAWTSSSPSDYGTALYLPNPLSIEWSAPATRISPWRGDALLCSSSMWVWCVED